jgi:adenylate kinase
MLNLVLFGPPGAGKDNLVHLSTGDIFRFNIKNATELGTLAKSYMDKGELVPDEVTINMLKAEVVKNSTAAGFIFDGFPRTIPQAEALDTLLASMNSSITLMVALEVPEEELLKRLLLRGKDSGRADDVDPNIIANRIKVYHDQTAVAADFYNKQGKFHSVQGVGEINDIFNSICTVINEHVMV